MRGRSTRRGQGQDGASSEPPWWTSSTVGSDWRRGFGRTAEPVSPAGRKFGSPARRRRTAAFRVTVRPMRERLQSLADPLLAAGIFVASLIDLLKGGSG